MTEAGEDLRRDIETLYREEGSRLWRSVMSFTGDRAVTDDAVAEAFAQLLHRGEAVRDPRAWVWKASFRIAAGELKRRGSPPIADAGRAYDLPDPLPEVLAAIAALPPMQRAVIILHDYADRPTADIADVLGIAGSTVRVHLSQARRRLRKKLEES